MKIRGILLVLLLVGMPALAAEKVLVTNEWPPYVGASLKNKGFTVEILEAAFAQAGYNTEIRLLPWSEAVGQTEAGTYDAVFNAYYSKDREKSFFYSDFYTNSLVVIFKPKGSPLTYETLEDLKPYSIGCPQGYVISPAFDAATSLKKVPLADEEACLKQLAAGEVDLAVVDLAVAQYLMETSLPEISGSVEWIEPPIAIHPVFILFPKQKPESEGLRNAFNRGLERIKADGTYDRIMQGARFGN